ncbi:Sec-independent protein translocase protein TatB [Acidocella sp.]|uniref:Sec-independent protein translocase protein TatB n=1 Tax=Acidocella sp. TaxID=50710 RepID=UPI00260ADB41|nr:Sec-independent protein translocase protein TatB [Acidocella sp.]
MFGFSWGEIGLILAVALIAIGPKDLPVAIRTVTAFIKKARGMAAEFQGHVDDMMREANLSDVKGEINKLRRFDFKTAAMETIDPNGNVREAVNEAKTAVEGAAATVASPAYVPPAPVVEEPPDAPSVIPPDAARKSPTPAFIPPGTRRWGY